MSEASSQHHLAVCALFLALPAAAESADLACSAAGPARNLPVVARESSGLAQGRERPELFWTHNDRGNDALLFAVDAEGRLAQTVRLPGSAIDWEDIESGSCPEGSCLYVGDIGDNDALREHIAIHRIPEPGSGTQEAGGIVTLRARYPEGPRDAESLFVLPSGDIFIVTKGRDTEVALYRLPAPQSEGDVVTLERVRGIAPVPTNSDDRVSAATASRDGSRVAIRTYRQLHFYDAALLVGGMPVAPATVDLALLGEGQGEGVALADDGVVWLSSEAANRRSLPVLNRLECSS